MNTGEIVAGDLASGQALVTGDAVNVAARLQQAAAPGEILIGEATSRLVRDSVRAERLEPVRLKGKEDAVAASRVIEVIPGAGPPARRFESPMVGREGELRVLRDAFERATRDEACWLFTVLGPAGVGKSRLLEEFVSQIGTEATILRGRCLPYGEGITYFPVLETLKQAAGLADFDAPEEAERKICAIVDGEEHASLICARVAHLLGLEEAVGQAEETFWAIRRFFEAIARRGPLVLMFDDLESGQPTLLDLIDHIADWTRVTPILLVCLARPELLDARSTWGGGKRNATTISLEPLTEGECATLIANLLGQAELAEEVLERIEEAAEGNPLFVEEMLSMLIDDGVLEREHGRWVATEDLARVSVPPSISALLAARLDRLNAGERAAIERAAVVGKVFYPEAVAQLSPEEEATQARANILSLVRKELVRPDRSTLPGEDAFRFRHLLIRDAAYDAIPKELRAELHERFAEWLEGVAGDRVAEQEEILGYHLEAAYRYRRELGPEDDRARRIAAAAGGRLAAAGRRARSRGDQRAASNLLGRAADLLSADEAARLDLLPDLGRALMDAGELDRAEAVLDEAIEKAEAGGHAREMAYALLVRAELRDWVDPVGWRGLRSAAEEARRVFEELGDDRGLARAWWLAAFDPWERSRAEEARDCWERAVAHAQGAGDRELELDCRFWLQMAAFWGPAPLSEAERMADDLEGDIGGSRELEARLLLVRSECSLRGRFDEARAFHRRAMRILEELGQSRYSLFAAQGAAYIEMAAGDWAAAAQVAREALASTRDSGGHAMADLHAVNLARALYEQGEYDEAERYALESERWESPITAVWGHAIRAKVLARRGRFEEAERLAGEAVALSDESDFIGEQADTWLDRAEVLRLAGKPDEAVAAAREALERYERKENVVYAGRARAFLDSLEVL